MMPPLCTKNSPAFKWGLGRMSICLAVLASSRKEIVCLTDRKVSFPSFSADHMTLKNEPFVGSCCVLTAGDDTEYIPLILESAKAELKPNAHPREVADAIDDAYHGQIAELIEKRVLKKFHFNCESFQKNGKKLLSEAVYARLCERIDKVNLSLKFLICGFDKNGIGHIFTAGGEQSVADTNILDYGQSARERKLHFLFWRFT